MVQLEELAADPPPAAPPAVSALLDNLTKKKQSSYYHAHVDRDTGGDLPAPPPPDGGTRMPNATDAAAAAPRPRPDESADPQRQQQKGSAPAPSVGQQKKNALDAPYYFAHKRAAGVTDAPAPMPPDGGVLLASGVAVTVVEREEVLKKYYFEVGPHRTCSALADARHVIAGCRLTQETRAQELKMRLMAWRATFATL